MYTIRKANSDDSKQLGEIHAKSWQVAYKGIVPDKILDNMIPEKRAVYFEQALKEEKEEDYLILKGEKALGFICIGKCRDEDKDDCYGEIWGIYLLPEYWRYGIGTKLIKWGLNNLKNRGYQKVTLWVLEDNWSARRFYEKMGFTFDDTIKELNIGKKLNEVRYVLDIK